MQYIVTCYLKFTTVQHNKCSATAEWATIWPQYTWIKNWGRLCPLGEGELGPHLTQCDQGRSLPPYQIASWSIQPFGHNRQGRKLGAVVPLWGGGAGSPSNTMSPGPTPISLPSGILIHPAVWPQQTWAENWGAVPFGEGEQGPHLTQCGLGQGLPPYRMAPWSIQPFCHNRHGPKFGGWERWS